MPLNHSGTALESFAVTVSRQQIRDVGALQTRDHWVNAQGSYVGVYFSASVFDCQEPHWRHMLRGAHKVTIDLSCHITLVKVEHGNVSMDETTKAIIVARMEAALKEPWLVVEVKMLHTREFEPHRMILTFDINSALSKKLWGLVDFTHSRVRLEREAARTSFHCSIDQAAVRLEL